MGRLFWAVKGAGPPQKLPNGVGVHERPHVLRDPLLLSCRKAEKCVLLLSVRVLLCWSVSLGQGVYNLVFEHPVRGGYRLVHSKGPANDGKTSSFFLGGRVSLLYLRITFIQAFFVFISHRNGHKFILSILFEN